MNLPSSMRHVSFPTDLVIPYCPSSLVPLCRSAAANGVGSAQRCLSFLCHTGWGGVRQDNAEALLWAERAAACGQPCPEALVASIRVAIDFELRSVATSAPFLKASVAQS
mmetsp:Transcript_10214/g.17847  ORF Transcript_10214/g.17847 Transcript_10214/m.17847 type:complete len:110 (+) Transcript_10214:964-1293(+)